MKKLSKLIDLSGDFTSEQIALAVIATIKMNDLHDYMINDGTKSLKTTPVLDEKDPIIQEMLCFDFKSLAKSIAKLETQTAYEDLQDKYGYDYPICDFNLEETLVDRCCMACLAIHKEIESNKDRLKGGNIYFSGNWRITILEGSDKYNYTISYVLESSDNY